MLHTQVTGMPLTDIPPPLLNALGSFVSSCSTTSLKGIVVSLMGAVFDGLPHNLKPRPGQAPTPKPKVGLIIMLAVILRTQPQVRRCWWQHMRSQLILTAHVSWTACAHNSQTMWGCWLQ